VPACIRIQELFWLFQQIAPSVERRPPNNESYPLSVRSFSPPSPRGSPPALKKGIAGPIPEAAARFPPPGDGRVLPSQYLLSKYFLRTLYCPPTQNVRTGFPGDRNAGRTPHRR